MMANLYIKISDLGFIYFFSFALAMKPSQGSGSFGAILGSRTSQKETNRQLSYSDNQVCSFESKSFLRNDRYSIR